jgi:hypothetical protein
VARLPPCPANFSTERTGHPSDLCTTNSEILRSARRFSCSSLVTCHSSLPANSVAALLRWVEVLLTKEDTEAILTRGEIFAGREEPTDLSYSLL